MRTLDTCTYLIVQDKKYQINQLKHFTYFNESLYSLDMRMLAETFKLICISFDLTLYLHLVHLEPQNFGGPRSYVQKLKCSLIEKKCVGPINGP